MVKDQVFNSLEALLGITKLSTLSKVVYFYGTIDGHYPAAVTVSDDVTCSSFGLVGNGVHTGDWRWNGVRYELWRTS